METRASYLLVGSFVLALMAAAVIFVLWLTGTTAEKTGRYHLKFSGSVTGLQVGSQVRYRGIPVGEVVAIDIITDETDERAPVTIEVTIEVRHDTPIRESTRASLEVQGITGVSFVQLTGESEPSPRLPPSTHRQKAYIPTKPSQIERIFQSFPELLAELTVLASQGRKLLNDENIDKISRSLDHFEAITEQIARGSSDLGALIQEGRKTLETAQPAIDNIGAAAAEIKTAATSIGAAADNLGGTANAIEGAAREMEVMIKTNQQPVADFAATGLYDISQFFIEARQLVGALSRIMKRFENDPARFLFGDQQRGYTTQ